MSYTFQILLALGYPDDPMNVRNVEITITCDRQLGQNDAIQLASVLYPRQRVWSVTISEH